MTKAISETVPTIDLYAPAYAATLRWLGMTAEIAPED